HSHISNFKQFFDSLLPINPNNNYRAWNDDDDDDDDSDAISVISIDR
ncbi:unnamed protein product, partial [Rotaria sp. Silwood2]